MAANAVADEAGLGSLSLKEAAVSVRFSLQFDSTYGQRVILSGPAVSLGNYDPAKSVALDYQHPGRWCTTVRFPLPLALAPPVARAGGAEGGAGSPAAAPAVTVDGDGTNLEYKYAIVDERDGGSISWELGAPRVLALTPGAAAETPTLPIAPLLLAQGVFRAKSDLPRDVFCSSAFTDVVFRREPATRVSTAVRAARDASAVAAAMVAGQGALAVRFVVFAPRVVAGDTVCVAGDHDALGGSDGGVAAAVPLDDTDLPYWTGTVAFPPGTSHFSYHFLVRRAAGGDSSATAADEDAAADGTLEEVVSEARHSRLFALLDDDVTAVRGVKDGQTAIVVPPSDCSFAYPRPWKGSGVAVPVFSLRSSTGCGVGEFVDLEAMVDLCVASGWQMLQLLPVNDTTAYGDYRDSYPYSAVSSFALHPQYIHLPSVTDLQGDLAAEYEAESARLNALPEIDYVDVMAVKMRFLRRIYAQEKEEVLQSRAFLDWFNTNQSWAVPYALFRFLMHVNGSCEFDGWGARSSMTPGDMEALAAPDTFHFDHVGLVLFTQFHLHRQLQAASAYASQHSVVFKGDLPIGVNRYCADTWQHPELFRLHMQAGAPPDFFSTAGQNWLFPTYDWKAMAADGYGWWRARLGHMANYFHAYRIDHILGFFRIWEIPHSYLTGMAGRFRPVIGITKQELESQGLWDMDRYTRPYVREGFLYDTFGGRGGEVKDRFFVHLYHDRLGFRPEYDTERKLAAALGPEEAGADGDFIKAVRKELVSLLNNVVLLTDVEEDGVYHPRFGLERTSSFAELPSEEWKSSLRQLYHNYFFVRQEALWRASGLAKLPAIQAASQMMVCGEDLGMIPACVPDVLDETSIMGLRVQRMPEGDIEFGAPAEYPYATVCTTSSHDTSTLRAWWEEQDGAAKRRYWSGIMGRHGETPPATATGELVRAVVEDHLASPSMWTVLPLQDWLGMDEAVRRPVATEEQINDPGDPQHIWRFRLHLNVRSLLENKDLTGQWASMSTKAGRGPPY